MRQFLLPQGYRGESQIVLTDEPFHYLIHVLRLRRGDTFPGIDKSGNEYLLSILEAETSHCSVLVEKLHHKREEKNRLPNNLDVKIILFQCIAKSKKMDTIVRQATEAGVCEVHPLFSRYSISKDINFDTDSKLKRWNRIVREAVQQSGSAVVTEIKPPKQLREIGTFRETDKKRRGLFFHQNVLENRTLHDYLSSNPQEIGLVIGPEGGFSDKEVVMLQEHGFFPVFFGATILRTETAALYAVAAVKTILAERGTWRLHQ